MYDPAQLENDHEWQQALYAAFEREPAPEKLCLQVERRLFDARQSQGVPLFRMLSLSTRSAWSSLWSIAAHAAVFAALALALLHPKRETILKNHPNVTDVDLKA